MADGFPKVIIVLLKDLLALYDCATFPRPFCLSLLSICQGTKSVLIRNQLGVDEGAEVPLQVDLGDWLCTQQHWAEDPDARGPPGWDPKPFLQIGLGNEVELLQVGLVEVVDSKVVSQGRHGIPDVDGHLELPSDFGLVNIRQFGAKLVLEKVQVILGSVV